MLTGAPLTHSLPEVQERIRAFCAKYRKAELFARGIADGATLAPVNTVADVLALDHLAARRYWQPYRLPDGRVLRAPGPVRAPVAHAGRRSPGRLRPPASTVTEVLGSLDGRAHGAGGNRAARDGRALPLCRSPASRSPTSPGSASDRSPPSTSPTTARRWCTSRPSSPPIGCALVGPFKDNIPGVNRCQFFALLQHLEAVAGAQPEAPRGSRGRQAADRLGGRLSRLVHRRHHGRSRPRLRRRARDQSRASSWRAPA